MPDKYIVVGLIAVISAIVIGFTLFIETPAKGATTDSDTRLMPISIPSMALTNDCNWVIYQTGTGTTKTINGANCVTQQVKYVSTNATIVIQNVFNEINKAGGGRVHIVGYAKNGTVSGAYNITGSIQVPYSGYLDIYGDGSATQLRIPSGRDNVDMFYTAGTLSQDIFFNTWRDMRLEGNPAGTNNSGFYFNSVSHGMHDSLFEGLFIENFANDGVFISTPNSWNMMFTNDVFELSGKSGSGFCFEHAGGSDTRILSSKFLFCHGSYALKLTGGLNTISSSWFYQNDRSGILLGNQPNVVLGNKFFDNGLTTSNTYFDIALSGATNTVMNANTFSGSDQTNKTKCGVDIGDSTSINNNINANNFQPNAGASFGTAPICGFHSSGVNQIENNVGWNPRGKTTNFIDNSGLFFVSQSGTTGTIVNGTTYTISDSDVFITSTGGTTVSITIQDNNSNNIQTGLATLMQQPLPVGYKIKWTWHTIPTVTVYYQ